MVVVKYQSTIGRIGAGDAIMPYNFVYPNVGGNPFLIGIGMSGVPASQDGSILGQLLPDHSQAVPFIGTIPEGMPPNQRYYDITAAIPPYMNERLGGPHGIPGPNCYHVVMSLLGGEQFERRYVSDREISYYLTRDFQQSSAARNSFMSAVIYTRRIRVGSGLRMGFSRSASLLGMGVTTSGILTTALPHLRKPSVIPHAIGASHVHAFLDEKELPRPEGDFLGFRGGMRMALGAVATGVRERRRPIRATDPGVHGAVTLFGGTVYQKGCFGDHCGYKIVEVGKGMSSIDLKYERFRPPPEKENDDNFTPHFYVPVDRNPREVFGFNLELSTRLARFMPAVRHYLKRFRAVKDLTYGDFRNARIDLLSTENMWGVLRMMDAEFSAEMNTMDALLRIDSAIAEAYLELNSLKEQYQVMVDKFWPFKDTWSRERTHERLEELYGERYANPDSEDFRDEMKAHLEMRGIPESKWGFMIDAIATEVRSYDPIQFCPHKGGGRLKFYDILDRVAGSF